MTYPRVAMTSRSQGRSTARPGLPLILLLIMLTVLWVAGGASRADAMGQAAVRATAWTVLIVGAVTGIRAPLAAWRPVVFLLLATIGLVLLQLVPLPPDLWEALPGREMLTRAAGASQQAQPWRPLAIVPDGAVNAVSSLVVPLAVLLLVASLHEGDRVWLPGGLLALVTASMILGLLQFSGAGLNNPFINDAAGAVSGSFANRNHFALFLALGCLLAPAWAFWNDRRPGWRTPAALGLLLLFLLTILASGSRAGMLVGGLAFVLGLALARNGIRRELRGAPRWLFVAIVAGIVALVAILILLSVAADRAVSINRTLSLETGEDIRALGLPTIVAMTRAHLPVGSGFGSFDALFRISEPAALLGPSYLNHAHNDFIEIMLEGGVAGAVLLAVAVGWWLWASIGAWRSGSGAARLGSAMLLLILLASAVDYPARTPMMMAMIVVAAMWLSEGGKGAPRSALPVGRQQL